MTGSDGHGPTSSDLAAFVPTQNGSRRGSLARREDDCLAAFSRLAAKSAPSAPSIPLAALPWPRRLGAEPVHRSSMDVARARVTRAPCPCPACVAAAFAREKDCGKHWDPSSCLTHCPSHRAHSTLCAECARQEKIGGRLLSWGHRSDISHDVVVSVSDTVTQDGVLVASGAGSRRLRLRE